MLLQELEIRNYRCFEDVRLTLEGRPLFVLSENAGGKTTMLQAVARALGADRGGFSEHDFRDTALPIEIIATMVDLSPAQRGPLASAIDMTAPPSLKVGVRAVWDPAAEEAEREHGFPQHAWRHSTPAERAALEIVWLPAWRDAGELLAFGASRGVIARQLKSLPLGPALNKAVDDVRLAAAALGGQVDVQALLADAGDRLARALPDVGDDPFSLDVSTASDRDLLRQLGLQLAYRGPAARIVDHSGGLRQLAVFASASRFAVRTRSSSLTNPRSPFTRTLNEHSCALFESRVAKASSPRIQRTSSTKSIHAAWSDSGGIR